MGSRTLPPDVAAAAEDSARRFGPDGRYVLMGDLGSGGAGAVLKAYDTRLGRLVAIKGLYRADPRSLARFRREAALAARLRHPGIVSIHDFGDHDGQPYLVMDLVEGLPLHRATLDTRGKAAAVRDAARAVQCAHEQWILHRDLKPSNIMIEPSGHVLVMDFGLAREVKAGDDPRSGLTLTGDVLGTPQYMAPEQAQGRVHELDGRADVYGLGATLYELLSGRPPHDGATTFEVLTSVVTRDPPPPGASPELDKIVIKAMEKEPARRYPTAAALADDLDRFLRGEPVTATRASWTYRLRRRVRRNPWAWVVGIGLGAAVLLVLAGAFMSLGVARARAHSRARAHERAQQAGDAFGRGDLEVADSLASSALWRVPDEPVALYWRARVRLRRYESRRPLPSARVLAGSVVFSPAPAEGPEPAAERREIERALALRGAETSESHLAAAILAIWDARYDDALAALDRAEEAVVPGWDLPYYRVLALYLAGRFSKAWTTAQLTYVPAAPVRVLWLRAELAASLDAQLHGAEPDWAGMAARAEDLRRVDDAAGCLLESQILVAWARWKREHGRALDREHERALEAVEGIESVDASLARGDALLEHATDRAARGEIDPDDPMAFQEVVDSYTEAIERFPAEHILCARRADALQALGTWKLEEFGRASRDELTRALEDYQAALDAGLRHPDVLLGRAEMRSRLAYKPTGEAWVEVYTAWVAEARGVADEFPAYPPARLAHGDAANKLAVRMSAIGGDPETAFREALDAFTRVIEASPGLATAHRARATTYTNRATHVGRLRRELSPDVEAAFADLDRALEIDPTSSEAYRQRAEARHNFAVIIAKPDRRPVEEFRAAIEDATRAVECNPANAPALYGRAMSRMNLGSVCAADRPAEAVACYDEAAADLDRVQELNPRLATIPLARCLLALGRGDQARRLGQDPTDHYRDAVQAIDERGPVTAHSTEAFLQRGTAHERIADWQREQGIDPSDALQAAIVDYRRVTELNPSTTGAWTRLGQRLIDWAWLQERRGENPRPLLEEAIAAVEEAIQRSPTAAAPRYYRGVALARLGRRDEAQRDFDEAIRRDESYRATVERFLRSLPGDDY